jgi:hypothetical protein
VRLQSWEEGGEELPVEVELEAPRPPPRVIRGG